MKQMNITALREKYPSFIYKSYSWAIRDNSFIINFNFSLPPDINFNPKIMIRGLNPKEGIMERKEISPKVLDNLVFNLGLIEMISYWKATCSPSIVIQAGYLSEKQTEWWRNIIFKGLGQFFFSNKINFLDPNFLKIEVEAPFKLTEKFNSPLSPYNILVPIGGGKDSIVTLETFKKYKKKFNVRKLSCFALNPNPTIEKIFKEGNCLHPIRGERRIEDKLLLLNRKGYLNGHTPISAYLAFLSLLVSYLGGYNYAAFSNERSANEGNVYYLGREINHQWSKSFEFEFDFRNYVSRYLGKGINYFSFLRPLYELQIAKLFVKYPEYFKIFLSCNNAYKTYSGRITPLGRWCNNCPKCLFVYSILYPFIGREKTMDIFGEDLFNKKSLFPLMLELLGEKKFKPFECVGTKEETRVAFYLSLRRVIKKKQPLPFLLNYFKDNFLHKYGEKNLQLQKEEIFKSWNKNNFLNEDFKQMLKDEIGSIKK